MRRLPWTTRLLLAGEVTGFHRIQRTRFLRFGEATGIRRIVIALPGAE